MSEKQFDTSRKDQSNAKLCPSCGFPGKATDSKCLYCQTSMQSPASLPPGEWLKWYFARLQWKWKKKKYLKKAPDTLGKGITTLVGFALCIIGGFLLTLSITTSSFSNCIIALFFLLYGVFTLKSVLPKK